MTDKQMEEKKKEFWKDVKTGKRGQTYQISNRGNLRKISMFGKITELKSTLNQGYLLWKNHRVHRLVASKFIDNAENKPCINHINGIKTDNRAENLEWVTMSENSKHAYRTGLLPLGGKAAIHRKLSDEDVREIRATRINGFKDKLNIAFKYGVRRETIDNVLSFRTFKENN